MKTTKGGKVMNPTDAFRKEQRKKELKRNKKERKKVREVGILKKDPDALKDQIEKLKKMKAHGALDKARKHKKRQLEDTYNLVVKKRKFFRAHDSSLIFIPVPGISGKNERKCHLGPPKRRPAAEEDNRAKNSMPEDSVYYHPTLNPSGAPPPGKPPMYKSSIGPRIPLPSSSSAGASSSMPESEDAGPSTMPPPPPPPPLPASSELTDPSGPSLPLPPPPPPLKPVGDAAAPPPPHLDELPRDPVLSHTLLPPPPPPPQQPTQPLTLPGTISNKQGAGEGSTLKDFAQDSLVLSPPPPPARLQLKSNEMKAVDTNANDAPGVKEDAKISRVLPPPPPHPSQMLPLPPRPPIMRPVQHDMLTPGMARFPPPPPPPDSRPPFMALGATTRPPPPPPPGFPPAQMPMAPFGVLPGPPPMLRPPFYPGPPIQADDFTAFAPRPQFPQQPSYVKSAASTVVKRPLAQHTPELTAMIPASVRVKRETALPKPKPKVQQPSLVPPTSVQKPSVATIKSAAQPSHPVSKLQSIDDSYKAFLEDMKQLGALDE